MFLPPGAISIAGAPPTDFALRMRPWLYFMFVSMLLVAIARLAFLDVIGGAFLMLVSLSGFLALHGEINMASILSLAVVLFLNSVFDMLSLFSFVGSISGHFFSAEYPWQENFAHALLITGPVLELIVGVACWQVYADHVLSIPAENLLLLEEARFAQEAAAYGSSARRAAPQASGDQVLLPPGAVGHKLPGRFEAFQGSSCRL